MRLLGAYCPKTLDGTMVGKPMAAAAPRLVFKKPRRETLLWFVLFIETLRTSLSEFNLPA
jgi:hypothetical protein